MEIFDRLYVSEKYNVGIENDQHWKNINCLRHGKVI